MGLISGGNFGSNLSLNFDSEEVVELDISLVSTLGERRGSSESLNSGVGEGDGLVDLVKSTSGENRDLGTS